MLLLVLAFWEAEAKMKLKVEGSFFLGETSVRGNEEEGRWGCWESCQIAIEAEWRREERSVG